MVDIRPAGAHGPLPAGAAASARRVLVIANQTATSTALVSELCNRARRESVCFHLVVPALNSRLRHWLSDVDGAVALARGRRNTAAAALASHGLAVTAEVGDSAPLLALEDALSQFAADEIVISTLPRDRSHWLEQGLAERARERFGLPVSHVVADERPAQRPSELSRAHRPLTRHPARRRVRRASDPTVTS